MSEQAEASLEQAIESNSLNLLKTVRENGYDSTSWGSDNLKEVLQLLHSAFEDVKPLAAFASIGPCPQEGDECDSDCDLPNTLSVTPVFEAFDLERDAKYYKKTGEWLDRDDSDATRIDVKPFHLWMFPDKQNGTWEKEFANQDLVKIYPL